MYSRYPVAIVSRQRDRRDTLRKRWASVSKLVPQSGQDSFTCENQGRLWFSNLRGEILKYKCSLSFQCFDQTMFREELFVFKNLSLWSKWQKLLMESFLEGLGSKIISSGWPTSSDAVWRDYLRWAQWLRILTYHERARVIRYSSFQWEDSTSSFICGGKLLIS